MSKFVTLFLIGGAGYCTLELLWRNYTHWTMFILGGLCLYLLFTAFNFFEQSPLIVKALIGGTIITVMEFLTGCIINILLKWNIWNYSSVPFNLFGQICLLYSVFWVLLSIPIYYLCKLFRQYI